MKIIITAFVAAALSARAALPASAQTAAIQKQIAAARDTVWRAWYNNDTTLLRRFVPPAAATLEGGGQWNDRRQIANDARSFAQSNARLVDLKFTNTNIVQSGQSALVRSNFQTVVQHGAKVDTARGRATELFVRIGDTWVNPYWQLEPLKTAFNDAGREIILPDTMGANFNIADSTAMKGTPADYDALLGTWEFRYQGRRQDGTFNPAFKGHWTFEKKPGGGLTEDRWRPDNPTEVMTSSLYTYRTFDPEKKVWQMLGASSKGGEVQPGLTWSDEKYRYAIQHSHGAISRIRYLEIDENHFLWRSDLSLDGGKTWYLDNGIMEANRISK